MVTHETYIAQIAALACRHLAPKERELIDAIKLVYGAGSSGLRGVTYYNKWRGAGAPGSAPFVEICAFGQSSALQIAGTTLHELGHVLEHGAGHNGVWKAACERLGLRCAMAAGTEYKWSMFEASLRVAICALPTPDDGEPVVDLMGTLAGGAWGLIPFGQVLKPCGAGQGTKGGTSRGKGSGSRSRLYHCACVPPVKLRAATNTLACHCDHCSGAFALV